MKNKSTKLRDKMENKGSHGIIVYILVPVLIVCAIIYYNFMSRTSGINNSYNQVNQIKEHMQGGELIDYGNQIGMKDPDEDIRWYKEDDNIKIEFGYMLMNFPMEEFMSTKCTNELNAIGITHKVVKDENGDPTLKLYYMGVELDRWVS